MSVKISIIIPVFNAEKYLRQCLDSAKDQTLHEIEILCIDDGSTDSSGRILDEYAAADHRFVVLHTQNAGQSAARNRGLEIAKGEFVAFLDSDDWYDPDYCEKLRKRQAETDADMTLSLFTFEGFPEDVSLTLRHLDFDTAEDDLNKIRMIYKTWTVVWNTLYRRSFIEENHLRFLEGFLFEDTAFSLKAGLLAKRTALLRQSFYHYRFGGYSTNSLSQKKKFRQLDMFDALFKEIMPTIRNSKVRNLLYKIKQGNIWQIWRSFSPELQQEYEIYVRARLTPTDWILLHSLNLKLRDRRLQFFYRHIYRKRYFFPTVLIQKIYWFFRTQSRSFVEKNLCSR